MCSVGSAGIDVAALPTSGKAREVVVELGSLSSEILSAVMIVFAVFAALMVALVVMVYIQARQGGEEGCGRR